ncbi:MAG: cytochrome b [Amaricoccus sp.]|uniref:cytochrome b n=1 Tax=Amaricoccus sp. TaxID=1872485 RepID=UPI003314E35B
MGARGTATGWGCVARAFHWGMAGLILFMLGLGVYMANFVPDLLRQFELFQLHKSWGFVVFFLALARLGWRLLDRTPEEPAGMPAWQRVAARASHAALYVLMLAMPLSGWIMVSASPDADILGIRNMVFGLFPMPDPWVPGNAGLETAAGEFHAAAAILLAALLVMHAAAALWHHFGARDAVLRRMVVGR